jgi:hypothetical protein
VDTDGNRVLINSLEKESDLMLDDYFRCVTFYPDEMFPDGVHFGGDYKNINQYKKCIQDLCDKSEVLDGFVYQ